MATGIESRFRKSFLYCKPVRFLLYEILHAADGIHRLTSTFLTLLHLTSQPAAVGKAVKLFLLMPVQY